MGRQYQTWIGRLRHRACVLIGRCSRDQAGTTAIEFGMIGVPFVTLLFGTLSAGLYFFTNFAMATGLSMASRAILTGQFQQQTGSYNGATTLQAQESVFRSALCSKLPAYINCSQIVIMAQSNNTFSGISQPACAVGGALITQSTANTTFSVGSASSVVLVTACYAWSLVGVPFLKVGDLSNGSFLIQTSVVFRTEPYT
jgi:Flp pilus assembly protein TadG